MLCFFESENTDNDYQKMAAIFDMSGRILMDILQKENPVGWQPLSLKQMVCFTVYECGC